MDQDQILSARDEQTGRVVRFQWHEATPPTQEDLAEIFASQPPEADTAGALKGLSKAESIGPALNNRQMADALMKEQSPSGAMLRGLQSGGAITPGLNIVGGSPDVLGRLVKFIGDKVTNRAVPFVRSAIKAPYEEMKHRAGIAGTNVDATANELAQYIVDNQIRNPEQARSIVSSEGQAIDSLVSEFETANPRAKLDIKDRIPAYLTKFLKEKIEPQLMPGKDRAAVNAAAQEFLADSPLTRTIAAGSTIREIRPNVRPSEGLEAVRTKSFFDKNADPGKIMGGKQIERAVRDSGKDLIPDTVPHLQRQGMAMDAESTLSRSAWRDANRDTLGMGAIAGVAHHTPLLGALMQAVKNEGLPVGLAAGRIGPKIARTGQEMGDTNALTMALQRLLAAGSSGPQP